MQETIDYIYDPETVNEVLQRYPSVRQKLKNPAKEGRPSVSFSWCRKTGREIYRVLSNQHYSRLVELLGTLDYCVANGWEQPKLLQTRGQEEFDSSVAALFVAESFLRRSLKVNGFDDRKGMVRVPDMLVESGKMSVGIEVYCPRDWNGLEYFLEELRLGILHLDVPWDFRFEIDMGLINERGSDEEPLWFNPWQFSRANENPADRRAKIRLILSEIVTKLTRSAGSEIVACLRDDKLNVLIKARLFEVTKSSGRSPDRKGSVSGPTLTGYAPEHMFDKLIEKRIVGKIKKGQAQALRGDHLTALIVDVSRLGCASEFTHPYYLQLFGTSVKNHLDPDTVDLDMVVFCFSEPVASTHMVIPVLFRKPSLSDDAFDTLFGGGRSFNALSKEVFIEERRLSSLCP